MARQDTPQDGPQDAEPGAQRMDHGAMGGGAADPPATSGGEGRGTAQGPARTDGGGMAQGSAGGGTGGMDRGAMGGGGGMGQGSAGGGGGGMDHGAMGGGGGGGGMRTTATRPQLIAMSAITVLMLTAAVLFSASRYNLTLSKRSVGGLIMPPGMINTRGSSAEAMRDMAAVNTDSVQYTAPADARGDQTLQPRIEDGVKVYDLEASVIKWNILEDVQVSAYAYNGQVPGPRIRVTQGDRLRINVTNNLPEPTSVHWHGLVLPNGMDGAAGVTQPAIEPGATFVYEFTAGQVGTYFYHSHADPDRQQALGLYGALIIDPATPPAVPAWDKEVVIELQEWLFRDGYTFPAMPMEGAMPNYFTINGKAYPSTETVKMKVGEKLLVRFIGSSSAMIHPMHIHGGPFRIVATDGNPVPEAAQLLKDTVSVAPGERYDVIWEARQPGKWLLHCHINHHTKNDNREDQGAGGLTMIIDVQS